MIETMTFGEKVTQFYRSLKDFKSLPGDFESIFPFEDEEVRRVMSEFYHGYYADKKDRTYLYGINPGRFGAGITGISFTDPILLHEKCGIQNDFQKRHETSSLFIYEVIDRWGGPESFYKHFYITSICPIGFLRDGKNANYYDDKELASFVQNDIIELMWRQIKLGANREIAFSIGQGENFKKLKALNDEHGFFDQVRPLPHPRWVMQYRRKKMDTFADQYITELYKAIHNE